MCGIFGIGLLKNNVNVKRAVLRVLLRGLACSAQSRGTDATGYAFTSDNYINIFKHNVFASKFVELSNYKEIVRNNFLPGKLPYSVIGHTRFETQGSHTNPANNHPIETGNIVGVHNGQISNDYALFSKLEKNTSGKVKRIAEVDSEIIFSLINYYSKIYKFSYDATSNLAADNETTDPTSRAIARTANDINGGFSCAAVDAENPKILWLFKGYGQMVIHYYEKEGIIIFASTLTIIQDAIRVLNFSEPEKIELKMQEGLCINLETNEYNVFSLTKKFSNYLDDKENVCQ